MDIVEETTSEGNNKRMIWIVSAAAVVALVVIGGVIYALVGIANKGQQNAQDTKNKDTVLVATSEEVQKNILSLNESIARLKSDKLAAVTSLNDKNKQVKVGE